MIPPPFGHAPSPRGEGSARRLAPSRGREKETDSISYREIHGYYFECDRDLFFSLEENKRMGRLPSEPPHRLSGGKQRLSSDLGGLTREAIAGIGKMRRHRAVSLAVNIYRVVVEFNVGALSSAKIGGDCATRS